MILLLLEARSNSQAQFYSSKGEITVGNILESIDMYVMQGLKLGENIKSGKSSFENELD